MGTRRPWIVAAAILAAVVAIPSCVASTLNRIAPLGHGRSLQTTRDLVFAAGPRRMLMSDDNGAVVEGSQAEVWVVGLPPARQAAVHKTLQAIGGHVMHPLPGDSHHWIVSATLPAVTQLLQAHTDVTAMLLPPEYKISPGLHSMMDAVKRDPATYKAGGRDKVALSALMPVATPQQVNSAVATLMRDLAPIVQRNSSLESGCALKVSATRNVLRLSVCKKDLSVVAARLADMPTVSWVDLLQRITPHNLPNAAAQQVAELNDKPKLPKDLQDGVKSGLFPYWKAGLDGTGQVVGHVDSGVDMDSCFFYDPKEKNYLESKNTRTIEATPFNKASDPDTYLGGANRVTLEGKNVFTDPTHRKVVQFVMWSADYDSSGHGTHTAASIAGSIYGTDPLKNPSLGTGIAPGAKLAVFNIGDSSFDEAYNGFDDADPGIFYDTQHQAGARISSNSWGTKDTNYSAPLCFMLDAYAWTTQDILHVFSAGNSGDRLDLLPTTGSTVAPSSCKNTLSVGATETWINEKLAVGETNLLKSDGKIVKIDTSLFVAPKPRLDRKIVLKALDDSFTRELINYGKNSRTAYIPLTGDDGDIPQANQDEQDQEAGPPDSSFKSSFESLKDKKSIRLVLANPVNACKKLTGRYKSSKLDEATIVLVQQAFDSGCDGATSLKNVADSGADGLLMFWEDDGVGLMRSGSEAFRGRTFPALTIRSELGFELANTLSDDISVSITLESVPASPIPTENVAWFSSFGSGGDPSQEPDGDYTTLDVRFKPDLVAPGWALSATTDSEFTGEVDQCATTVRAGTSMAAPIVSGSAAIVRQYFVNGFYPGGKKSSKSHEPSAPLVKAVLIAGTAAMSGISRVNGELLAPPPSPFQGYGRLDLSASLPLAGDERGWNLQVIDGEVFETDGVEKKYKIKVPASAAGKQPLSVTLVWHDYPAFPGAKYVLVNDLDLVISAPGGKTLWGNGRDGGDYHNNVEKVYVNKTSAGTYTISVRASYLFIAARPQRYSLVVLGGFTGKLDSKANPAS